MQGSLGYRGISRLPLLLNETQAHSLRELKENSWNYGLVIKLLSSIYGGVHTALSSLPSLHSSA